MALKMTPKDVFSPTLNHTIISWKLKKIYVFLNFGHICIFGILCKHFIHKLLNIKNFIFFKKSILAQKLIKGMNFRSLITIFPSDTSRARFLDFFEKSAFLQDFVMNCISNILGITECSNRSISKKIILQPFRSVKIDDFSYSSH